jgi:KDO2-lipid IV(A) lauroyltransferase
MSAQDRSTFTKIDWIVSYIAGALIAVLLKLPYETRVRLMGRVMRGVIAPLAGYRKRAEANLALIYPDMPAAARRRLANASCDNFGRTVIENFSPREFAARVAQTPPQGAGIAAIQDAVAQNRPVLFVSGHFGNYEAPRHALLAMGHAICGLYRPMRNGYFNARYTEAFANWGGATYPQGRTGTVQFIREIRNNGMGLLMFDLSAPGPQLPFLGHDARTSLSTAQIALKHDAVVIPYFGIRQPDGFSFNVLFQDPIAPGSPEDMVLAMNARLEALIANHPEQWFWVHRRWKS